MVILNTEVETERKPDYPWEEAAYCVCSRVLEQEGFPYDGEVELLLTTPDEIRAMNREHRDTDRVTDVLSFPMLDYGEGPADFSVVEGMELILSSTWTGSGNRRRATAIRSCGNSLSWWPTACCICAAMTI